MVAGPTELVVYADAVTKSYITLGKRSVYNHYIFKFVIKINYWF